MLITPYPSAAHYFKITGDASITADGENIITITVYDQDDNVATGYNGDKTLIFSGAGSPPDSVISPTCSNKDNAQIDFGSDTIVTFTDGVGTSRMKLYKVETAQIKASSYQDLIDTISDFVVEVTAAVIQIAAIPGVTIPVSGADPVGTITETGQYTGTVTWSPYETYGGGIVAYIFIFGDPDYVANEQHGLIAATKDQSTDGRDTMV